MRLVGDSELERGAFKLLPVGQTDSDPAEQQVCYTRGEGPTVVAQFYHGATEELQCLASIELFRSSWQIASPCDAKKRPTSINRVCFNALNETIAHHGDVGDCCAAGCPPGL